MSTVDIIILIGIGLGAVIGFKEGVIKKTADFVGMFVITVAAFYFKNYLSVLMYENLPFFNLFGLVKGVEVINVLVYEVIAFLIVFAVFYFVLKVILMVTGLIEKILKATVILSIPSKLLGIVVGAVQYYVYAFLILVILTLPVFQIPGVRESNVGNFILNNTPILSPVAKEMVGIYDDVYVVIQDKKNKTNEQLNEVILKLLIDKKFVTKESMKKLVDQNKIHINDYSIVQ